MQKHEKIQNKEKNQSKEILRSEKYHGNNTEGC